MEQFFSNNPNLFHFKLFGFWHILITLLTIIAIVIIIKYQDKIKAKVKHEKAIRYFIAIVMFLNMTIYYGQKLLAGTYDIRVHLPLHFCFISGYLFMFTLITNNKKLFRIVYFFSFVGPLPAIIFPDLICGPDRFIFWQFVISHHFFITSSIFCLKILDFKVERSDMLKAFITANLVFLAVFIFNHIFNTNYIMTSKLPDHIIKLFPFVKAFDYPIIWLEGTGLVAFYIGSLLTNKKPIKKTKSLEFKEA